MKTTEQNKRPEQEKYTKVAPAAGSDQKKREEPTRKAGESGQEHKERPAS